MNDPRILNLAKVLVRYSIAARPRQTVSVSGNTVAEPLLVAVYEELIRAGAYPLLRMTPPGLGEVFMASRWKHHFELLPAYAAALAETTDASISVHSQTNTREMSAVDPKKEATLARTHAPLSEIAMRKPWVLTLYPTAAYAQDAEMSLRAFEDFVYGATFADTDDPVGAWREVHRRQAKLIARLRGADEIRIVGPDTDLKLSVKGRVFVNSDGRHNMPSGEVFTGPVETSAEGYIRYDYPVCRQGREVEGVRLVFRKGVIVEATADKNQVFLEAMLNTDPGARRLGELGIGTNTGITKFTKNILFDEKIAGTVHLAIGRSLAGTRGTNKSAVHWDMIKDLRRGGAVYVNGKLLQKDGKFVGR